MLERAKDNFHIRRNKKNKKMQLSALSDPKRYNILKTK